MSSHRPLTRAGRLAHRIGCFFAEEERLFGPGERPAVSGSPASPQHGAPLRAAYAVIAVLLGLTAGLGSAFVLVNAPTIQQAMGWSAVEVAWLPTAYVMTSISANLVLIKFRQQYGLRPFAILFLGLYAMFAFGHLAATDLGHAIALRAASGIAAAALIPLCLFYMTQALPAKWRIRGLVLGIGVVQCALPLAMVLSPALLAASERRSLFEFEAGLALLSLAAVALVRLPPTERTRVFQTLDAATFGLMGGGLALVAAVAGLGLESGWSPGWIPLALAAAVPLIGLGVGIELKRPQPLIDLRWLARSEAVRFALAVLMARLVLAEQQIAMNLLRTLGARPDQLEALAGLILMGAAAGVAASAVSINVEKLARPMMLAVAVVAVAAFVESAPADLDALPRFYGSQFVIGFAGAYFLGPALLMGVTQALQRGSRELISFIVLFGLINAVGALLGHALLATVLDWSRARHEAALADDAIVLAYRDTLRLAAMLAMATAVYLGVLLSIRIRARLVQLKAGAAPSPPPAVAAVPSQWRPPAASLAETIVLCGVAAGGAALVIRAFIP